MPCRPDCANVIPANTESGYWNQFSQKVALRWRGFVKQDFTGPIEFEPQPSELWPDKPFYLGIQTMDLAKRNVFVVSYADSTEPPIGRIRRSQIVAVSGPADAKVAELRQIEITQLVRPWRDLPVKQLAEAIASDEVIKSLTSIDGQSQGRPEQADEQHRPDSGCEPLRGLNSLSAWRENAPNHQQ